MFNIMSFSGVIIFFIWLGVIVYFITLAIRLVKGVERIADILERKNSS